MKEERRRILDMLASGKIDSEQAERLLNALESGGDGNNANANAEDSVKTKGKPKYLCVQIEPGANCHTDCEQVNVKVPLLLLKTGIKLTSLMPKSARGKFSEHLHEHGMDIDFDKLDSKSLDDLITALTEASIDVQSDRENVRIFCM